MIPTGDATLQKRHRCSMLHWHTGLVCIKSKPRWRTLPSSLPTTRPISISRTRSTPKSRSGMPISRVSSPLLSKNSQRRVLSSLSRGVPSRFTLSTTRCRRSIVMWIGFTICLPYVSFWSRPPTAKSRIVGRSIRSLRTFFNLIRNAYATGYRCLKRTVTRVCIPPSSARTTVG